MYMLSIYQMPDKLRSQHECVHCACTTWPKLYPTHPQTTHTLFERTVTPRRANSLVDGATTRECGLRRTSISIIYGGYTDCETLGTALCMAVQSEALGACRCSDFRICRFFDWHPYSWTAASATRNAVAEGCAIGRLVVFIEINLLGEVVWQCRSDHPHSYGWML